MGASILYTLIAHQIWDTKYRYREGMLIHDHHIEDTWRRVAKTLASVESQDQAAWEDRFYALLTDFKFLPGGRILAGAGTKRRVTLFNCFVMGLIEDSMDGIFDGLKEGALTMQQGGGVGYDFSTLRPHGVMARGVGGIASGPVSFMRIWDSMCATLLSTGARRGAMMATLRCDHPDIEYFIDAKKDPRELRHFNLSVQVTDGFMKAVREDEDWLLVFPESHLDDDPGSAGKGLVTRDWPGFKFPVPCRVLRVVKARALWERLMRATYDYAEPGVLFIDRINRMNNLWYRERISATNPCGEVPLPPYGACDLGSINLTRFVERPFTAEARLDLEGIAAAAPLAVRMLDNVIDASRFPLEAQAREARETRHIGLGVTGLADTLIMLGLRYGGESSYDVAATIMQTLCHSAYRASIELACEKGSFPAFDKERYPQGAFILGLPEDIQAGIAQSGLRNSHLIAIAPTGTISLFANNVSSGLEPAFDLHYTRRIREADGSCRTIELTNGALRLWRELRGDEPLPPQFVDVGSLIPSVHLRMQAAIQPYVDNSISKTINVPEDFDFAAFRAVYEEAHALGLKGCTTFRPNPITGEVLSSKEDGEESPHCCGIEREAD